MKHRFRAITATFLALSVLLTALPVPAEDAVSTALTEGAYTYELPAEKSALCERLLDGDVATRITLSAGKTVRVTRADGEPLCGLYVTWYETPAQITVTRLDANGKALSKERVKGESRHQYFAGGTDCSGIEFTSGKGSYTVADVRPVASESELPFSPSASETACDAVVFVTRPGEEYTVYGGMLPALVSYGLDVQVIYLESASRRVEEPAFSALSMLGITREPIFWDLSAVDPSDTKALMKSWKLALKKVSVASTLEALNPTLIIAPDGSDESLSIEQQTTGLMVQEGYEKATGLSESTRLMLITSASDSALSTSWTDSGREQAETLYASFTSEWLYHRKIPTTVRFRFADTGALSGETGPIDTELLLPLIFIDKTLKVEPELADGTPVSATPAPETTETPEPTPEAVSDPDDRYFRQEGEPEEVVSSDVEAGHWEYRSDTLSVIVDRHVDTETPLVWCVAHIRMRERSSFRSIITKEISKEARLRSWRLARKTKSVLLITGDNLTTNETPVKGLLIRNDTFYADRKHEAAMMFTEDLGMAILERGAVDGKELLESGVRDTYSFGPVLVENGEVQSERIQAHRVANNGNPRCGLGMVEPGHLVAITVDGRQKGYSLGVDLQAFAQMFIDEGCTLAYNLDGGGSTAMVFMGENVNVHGGQSWDKQRYLPEALSWGYSELVPDEDDPIENIGNGWGNLKELNQ